MSIVTKLTAILTADSAKFESGMKKASNSFGKFQSLIVTGTKIVSGALAGLVGGLALLAIRQASVIDSTAKLSASLKISYSDFVAMSLVADEAGVSQEALGVALVKSQRFISEAANGNKNYIQTLSAIGLKSQDLLQLNPSEQFEQLAIALSNIENPTQRAAIAMDLFGKSGVAVLNAIQDYPEKFKEAQEFTQKFGLSLSEIDANKVQEANDAFGRIGKVVSGAGNIVAVQFSPLVTAASKALVDASISGEEFGYAIKYGMSIAGLAVDVVRKSILGLQILYAGAIQGVLELAAKAKEALTGDGGILRGAADLAKQDVRDIQREIQKFETSAQKLDKIYAEADKRNTVSKPSLVGDDNGVIEGLSKTSAKTKELQFDILKVRDVYGELAKSSGDAVDTLISDLGRGGNAMQSFRNFAVSILQDVLKSIGGGNSVGTSLGGIIAGGLGSLFGSSQISKGLAAGGSTTGLYSGLAAITGSFATGIQSVPYDMNARVHKGEMIVPRQQAENISSSSGDMIVNIDARGAEQGVEEKIRQVMAQVQQLRSDTPKIALNVVADQNRRNPNFVR